MAKNRRVGWEAAQVRCPFYISHMRQDASIRCEGFVDGADSLTRFKSSEGQDKHMGIYCAGRYERCPMYKCTYGAKYDD